VADSTSRENSDLNKSYAQQNESLDLAQPSLSIFKQPEMQEK